MIKLRANINITGPKLFLLVIIIFTAVSCNPTKYVPSGELLLSRNELSVNHGDEPLPATVNRSAMKPYIRQQPNKRFLGMRFHLGLFNLSNITREKWPHGWLRRIGEEPVIYDQVAAERSAGQIQSYLRSKGFFNATVTDTVNVLSGNEAKVVYRVNPGRPYRIADIRYEIQDSILSSLIMIDTVNCTVDRGMIYDVDLIREQILVAMGERLQAAPGEPRGHAIEFRINAEDPDHNFRPSPGKIDSLHFPGGMGVRIDSHIYQSYVIPPYYDSMVAKLIVWGKDRQRAIAKARRALEEFTVEDIKTTIPFHLEVLQDERFLSGNFDTSFLDKFLKDKSK